MSQMFTVSKTLLTDLEKLGAHLDEMTPKERTFVKGVGAFTLKTGKISYKQLRVLGAIYKRYFQDDQYEHHNWKIWKVS